GRVYAHNWIDYKDARYCEGCALATLARQWGE
ncbi:MAG TPA: N-acetylmuramoyl-L-alanine amidase, partial [Bradyrhizobium sp.]|nr:N-acetylmuramoyl-L-alanine amidase [Bradyrhizobium sp.]